MTQNLVSERVVSLFRFTSLCTFLILNCMLLNFILKAASMSWSLLKRLNFLMILGTLRTGWLGTGFGTGAASAAEAAASPMISRTRKQVCAQQGVKPVCAQRTRQTGTEAVPPRFAA